MWLKNDGKSNEFLESANESFKNLNYSQALASLNKALCFAVTKNQLGKLYANRAQFYFKLKKIKECQVDIMLAKNHGYSEELVKIENDCEQLSSESDLEENVYDIFELSLPTNDKIPFVAKCLKFYESWKFGRGVKTDLQLKTGDVVMIEEPFFKMLSSEARYYRCSNCFRSNFMNIFPCLRKCTSSKLVILRTLFLKLFI
jgi:hypothetical protein